jgi:hypothetical protein
VHHHFVCARQTLCHDPAKRATKGKPWPQVYGPEECDPKCSTFSIQAVIDHARHPQAPHTAEQIMNDVKRASGIDPRLDQDRGLRAKRLAARFAFANRQPFFAT